MLSCLLHCSFVHPYDHMNEFLTYFNNLTIVSDALANELKSRATAMFIKKGTLLHKAGSVCRKTYWVNKGILRTYYLKEGKEITDVFASEGNWITSVQSFMKGEPDQYFIQAIEDSELFALSSEDLMYLFQHFHEMERFGRITMSQSYIQLAQKLESYQFTTAKAKYDHFCKVYQPILNRLPLGMVASYLGITQETLSRVRKEF